MSYLSKAIKIASTEFEHRLDKCGRPYILHLLRVMMAVSKYGSAMMAAAVLHDILEDVPSFSPTRLLNEGMPELVVELVCGMTRNSDEVYRHYIMRIGQHKQLTLLKLADLEDNRDYNRFDYPIDIPVELMKRYDESHAYLLKQLYSNGGSNE